MLKWKSVRALVLVAVVFLGVSSVFLYLAFRRATLDETEYVDFLPYDPIAGGEVSFEQAQASVPFKIKVPVNMGQFVQVKLDSNTDFVAIIYLEDKPSNETTILDIINRNGVVLMELPYGGTMQEAESSVTAAMDAIKDCQSCKLEPVIINGYPGTAGGNIMHCVTWWTETTYYRLVASMNYPLDQLVEIAKSIPVN
jgi:hypothetical protein